jgi:hypothetical protein
MQILLVVLLAETGGISFLTLMYQRLRDLITSIQILLLITLVGSSVISLSLLLFSVGCRMRKRDPAILFTGFWAGVLLTTWCQNLALTHNLQPRTHILEAPPIFRPRPPSGVLKVQQQASHAQSSELQQHFATSSLTQPIESLADSRLQQSAVALQIDSVEKQVHKCMLRASNIGMD